MRREYLTSENDTLESLFKSIKSNMKKHLLAFLAFLICLSAFSQQPFEEYGYKVKVATLSNGKYVEFFDQDTLVEIGSVLLNTNTGKVEYFVTYDTAYSEATLQPEVISRWLSPDPLSEEFYSYSPYNFVFNNPIKFVDPDGQAASPYYDQEGNFLGVDEKGFEGEIYVTNKETFDKNAANGVADSKSIQADENTVGLQDAGLSAQGLSNVYTDVLAKGGYDPAKLDGGAVAVNNGPNDQANNPTNTGFMSTLHNGQGQFKITVNNTTDETKSLLTTVENIQNSAGAHEYRGHGEKRFGVANEAFHYKAYDEQRADPTWNKTTPNFQTEMFNKYRTVLRTTNPTVYKQRFPMDMRKH
jgi:hypothetical protein